MHSLAQTTHDDVKQAINDEEYFVVLAVSIRETSIFGFCLECYSFFADARYFGI